MRLASLVVLHGTTETPTVLRPRGNWSNICESKTEQFSEQVSLTLALVLSHTASLQVRRPAPCTSMQRPLAGTWAAGARRRPAAFESGTFSCLAIQVLYIFGLFTVISVGTARLCWARSGVLVARSHGPGEELPNLTTAIRITVIGMMMTNWPGPQLFCCTFFSFLDFVSGALALTCPRL